MEEEIEKKNNEFQFHKGTIRTYRIVQSWYVMTKISIP